jgi:hypothetical protein
MKEVLIQEYNNLEQLNLAYKQNENKFFINFVQGAKCEIVGDVQKSYIVKFIDTKFDKVLHESEITNNMWTKTAHSIFCKWWRVEVYDKETDELVFEHDFNPKIKRVYSFRFISYW